MRRFRLRPRYGLIAYLTMAIGVAIAAWGLAGAAGGERVAAVAGGAVGVVLGILYLASPAWRMVVVVDDEAIELLAGGDRRFRLPWAEVERVVASPTTQTCHLWGGGPERSLLVPGDGASAPYAIEHRAELYRIIVARVPKDVLEHVDLLEHAQRKDRADRSRE